jgi:C-terminal processing protease CtpA/Prc
MTATSSSSGTLGDPVTLNLTTVVLQEDPNFYSEVIDVDGTRKAGYLMYTFFASGIGEGIEYNNEMDQIIANFKAQGITDLIVDLRYNSGGYVDAAINLASLIGKNIDESKVFFRREYNSTVTDYFNITETDEVVRFIAKAQNVGNSLSGNLYVLTGTETASASELVINGLRPFMPVKLIGEVTYGKNVGSIPVYEEDNPANRWLMLPIVMKSFNSNGQSDYSNGFIPDLEVDEGIYLLPIGDREEPLLSAALAQIAGGPGRLALPSIRKVFGQRLGSSFDMKNKSMRRIILEKKPQTVFH